MRVLAIIAVQSGGNLPLPPSFLNPPLFAILGFTFAQKSGSSFQNAKLGGFRCNTTMKFSITEAEQSRKNGTGRESSKLRPITPGLTFAAAANCCNSNHFHLEKKSQERENGHRPFFKNNLVETHFSELPDLRKIKTYTNPT